DRYRARAGTHRAAGRLLREPEALPERGFLFGDHLRGDEISDGHVSGAVRHRTDAGMAGPVAGDAARQRAAHCPAAAGVHRRGQARLPTDRKKKLRRHAETGPTAGGVLPRGRAPIAPAWAAPRRPPSVGAAESTARTPG